MVNDEEMSGNKVYVKIPVLEDDGIMAITDKEKANILGKKFASVHSGDHLDDIHRQNKEKILNENRNVFLKKDNEESTMDEEIKIKSNQIKIKSLLLSHHHSTSALVSEILESVLQTVQKNKTIYI